jgi:hypothetical protein
MEEITTLVQPAMVTIEQDRFIELINEEQVLDMLFRAIYVGVDLSWNKKGLSFDKDRLSEFLEIADHERFAAVYKKLKLEDEAAKNTKAESEN